MYFIRDTVYALMIDTVLFIAPSQCLDIQFCDIAE